MNSEFHANQFGLTYIEIVIVLIIILIIVAITLPRFFDSFAVGGDKTQEEAQNIVAFLSTAQSFAASNRNDDHWGIYLVDDGTTDCDTTAAVDCIVMYEGNDYANRDTAYDQIYTLSSNNRFGDLQDTDFYFNKKTGYAHGLYGFPRRGLVGYWPFTASTTLDMSDKGNHGAIVNDPTYVTSTCAMGSDCYRFDNTNDYIEIPHNSTLDITGDLTISAWIKRTATTASDDDGNGGVILSKGQTANFEYELFIAQGTSHNNELSFYMDGNPAVYEYNYSGTTITDTTDWHHVVYKQEGVNWQYYLDGDAAGNGTDAVTLSTSNNPLRIGYDTYETPAGAWYFPGYIDEVMLFNRALSANEVSQIYNTTKPTSTTAGERISTNIHIVNGFATSTVVVYSNGTSKVVE